MVDRLNSADAALLHLETRTSPQHVGTFMLLSAPGGLDYDRLAHLMGERIALVPRYRQRLRSVPGRFVAPVWSDDPHFDLTYHLRRTALSRPAGDDVLLDYCACVMARPLDRNRPLWEAYLVEGLPDDRVALITKTSRVLLAGDGESGVAALLLDESPAPGRAVTGVWMPTREASRGRLLGDAALDALRRPATLIEAVRQVGSERLPRRARRSATRNGERRTAVARTRLDDVQEIARRDGGTITDAVVAVIRGALESGPRCYSVSICPSARPRAPLYAAGARVLELVPVPPIREADVLAIGVASYDGGVYFGLNGYPAALDLAALATAIEQQVAQLSITDRPAGRLAGAR